MKRGSTMFLRFVIFLLAIVVLTLCIFVSPTGISSDKTGMYSPILIGLYIPAIPFFYALYQALTLLTNIDKNKAFSSLSIKALKNIKYCAIAISVLFTAGMPYIFIVADKDDAPGAIVIGLVIIFASTVFATFAAVLQKLIQNGLEMKSENDLIV